MEAIPCAMMSFIYSTVVHVECVRIRGSSRYEMHLLRFYDVERQQGFLFRSIVWVDGGFE